VRSGTTRPFVPVTRETRKRIYQASPAFSLLKPHLEGYLGQGWEDSSCRHQKVTCGDVGAGWFMFELRDAAALTGHYASPTRASDFFGQIADEISAACARGKLECKPQLINEMPYYTWHQLASFPAPTITIVRALMLWDRPPFDPGDSTGDAATLGAALRFLHYPLHTRSKEIPAVTYQTIVGWYYASGNQWFSATAKDATTTQVLRIDRLPSPDVALSFNDGEASSQRFKLKFSCGEKCVLQFSVPGGAMAERDLTEFARGPPNLKVGGGTFHFELSVQTVDPANADTVLNSLSDRVRAFILEYYSKAFLPIAALGFVAFVATSLRYWRQALSNVCYILALASGSLVAGRLALLVLMDLTSVPAISFKYIAPAYFQLVCAAVFSIAALLQLSGRLRTDHG
jgi:hypothetical protein